VREGILSAIGNTPLVRLSHLFAGCEFQVFAKLEGFNPGGSIKDRAAYTILNNALETGVIRLDSIVIESSSGNMGIGLAQVCAYLKLRFICVVDIKTTKQNIEILKTYGAQVEMVTDPDPVTGEFLQARINRVQSLIQSLENSWWANQYANIFNAMAHRQTMEEIIMNLEGRVDYLFCATSTCGTIRGCSDYVREQGLPTKIIAVDALGSAIFNNDETRPRLIPGHGAAIRPELYRPNMADHCVHVSDLDCVVGCRRLLRCEAILAGGSSGAVIAALDKMRQLIPEEAICVAILPDRGDRYLDTIYSDAWVSQHFGDVYHLWEDPEEVNSHPPVSEQEPRSTTVVS
jgi:N-(2-amino-2-carboxyethyl)-L-glutamate synthase